MCARPLWLWKGWSCSCCCCCRQNTFLFLPVAFLGLHLSNIYAFLMWQLKWWDTAAGRHPFHLPRLALTLGIRCMERPTYSYENCVQLMQFVVLWNFTTLWQRSTLARAKTARAVNQRIMCWNFVDSAGFHILYTYITLPDVFKGNVKRNLLEINKAAAVIIKS